MRAALLPVALSTLFVSHSALAVSSAEFYTSQGYQFGRFEARIQFAPGDGVISSFFLWKDGSEVKGTFWNELDFEKLGGDCHLQTNAIYGSPAKYTEQKASLDFDICTQFHTYAYEWTPEYIAWLVDGVEIRRESGAIATAFAQNTASGMQVRFNVWPGDATFGGNFDPSILPVYQYVNWVQYSSYENGIFQPQWRHDFNDSTLPSGWSKGNWKSPKNLSTHSANNIGIVDGNLVIALTDDTARGMPNSAPADTSEGTGGSSSVGGASSVGGSASNGGGTSTAANPTVGGSPTSGGGAGGAAATTAAPIAGSSATPPNDDDGGCSITLGSTRDRNPLIGCFAAMLGALTILLRRMAAKRRL
ncbi:MAG: family 16 glycosylhydrolase [Polyangiaceae bacterium]